MLLVLIRIVSLRQIPTTNDFIETKAYISCNVHLHVNWDITYWSLNRSGRLIDVVARAKFTIFKLYLFHVCLSSRFLRRWSVGPSFLNCDCIFFIFSVCLFDFVYQSSCLCIEKRTNTISVSEHHRYFHEWLHGVDINSNI